MIKRRKHEKFLHMMRRFEQRDHRFGNVNEVMRNSRRYHIGPSKRRQLKSKIARKRNKAIRRRNKYRNKKSYY